MRIFTPGGELPFAGHPTLGSCHAWLERGGRAAARTAGRAAVRRRPGAASERDGAGSRSRRRRWRAPRSATTTSPRVLAALGIGRDRLVAAQWLDNGPHWLTLLLDSAATVLALEPDCGADEALRARSASSAPHPAGSECAFEVRGFVGRPSLYEDPVTGSLNAGLAHG